VHTVIVFFCEVFSLLTRFQLRLTAHCI